MKQVRDGLNIERQQKGGNGVPNSRSHSVKWTDWDLWMSVEFVLSINFLNLQIFHFSSNFQNFKDKEIIGIVKAKVV